LKSSIEKKSAKLTTKANINVRTRSPISLDISEPKWYKELRKRFNLFNCFVDDCKGEFGREWFNNVDPLLLLRLVVDVVIDGITIIVVEDEIELSFESVGIDDLEKKKKKKWKTFGQHATDCTILSNNMVSFQRMSSAYKDER
jgi:hypothetical protein